MLEVFNTKQIFLNDELGKSDKERICQYVVGDKILEIGSGSGIHLNMLEEKFPSAQITGVDISSAVVDSLLLRKKCENRKWNIIQGDATQITFNEGFDSIIFCSILHEVFSYNGFSYDALRKAFVNAFNMLNKGGRIIIRDGIMSSDNYLRKIKFLKRDGINFLEQYCNDFKGRKINFIKISDDEVYMHHNNAMEFLYTYTWGYEAYQCEVQEQYGYFTPDQYLNFLRTLWGDRIKIQYFETYLQDGYVKALSDKIQFFDQNDCELRLPDSNCLLIIEKLF